MRAISLLIVMLSLLSCSKFSGPSSYEDCILENMKGTSSDTAARAIALACSAKFPKPCQKPITHNGKTYNFPCDAADEEINKFLEKQNSGSAQ